MPAIHLSDKEAAKVGVLAKDLSKLTPKSERTKKPKVMVEPSLEICLTLPVEVKSDQNSKGSHWAKQYRFKKEQRKALAEWFLQYQSSIGGAMQWQKVGVTLVRLGSVTKMDAHENLPQSFKAIVDEIAVWLGIDDGDTDRVQWFYDQDPSGKPGIKVVFKRLA